jgi:hypothetical protein
MASTTMARRWRGGDAMAATRAAADASKSPTLMMFGLWQGLIRRNRRLASIRVMKYQLDVRFELTLA